jgi:hypothetical protein
MFGFSPSTFSDPFDVNKVAGTNSREQAKLKSQAFLTDSQLGGAATGIFAQNKAEDIMAKANASAQATGRNAAGISGLLSAAGSIGSFGAAGGFGGGVTDFSQPVAGVPGARETIGGYGGNEFFTPSEVPGFTIPDFSLNTPRDIVKYPYK